MSSLHRAPGSALIRSRDADTEEFVRRRLEAREPDHGAGTRLTDMRRCAHFADAGALR